LALLAASFIYTGTLDRAAGQLRHEEFVVIYGRVQWIAGARMVVAADCLVTEVGCTAVSVPIDLTRVSLSDYRGVTSGTWVFVEGFVRHENGHHRIIATSVKQVEQPEAP
jgi:hypothetical protein